MRISSVSFIPGLAVLLGGSLIPVDSTAHAAATASYVLQISVDGLRGDLLQELVETSPQLVPNFVRLQSQGAHTYNARCDVDNSSTVPNHVTMISGRPVLQPPGVADNIHHGFENNFPTGTIHDEANPEVPYVHSTFDVTHDRGLRTGLYVGKTRLSLLRSSYDAVNGADDLIGEDNGRDKIDDAIVQDNGTQALVDRVAFHLTNAPLNYVFLHLVDPDIPGGHSFGWGSVQYDGTVADTDAYLGTLFQAIDANPALAGRVALILTADHGGGGEVLNNHRDPSFRENYFIPFFLWAPGIVPGGANLYSLMLNRIEPGTERPDYVGDPQPIRNGDAPNLAMALLGLPFVPGSYLVPELNLEDPTLVWERNGQTLHMNWPKSPSGLVLEHTLDLTHPDWQKQEEDLVDEGLRWSYTKELNLQDQAAFYRLRQIGVSITGQPADVLVGSGSNATFQVSVQSTLPVSYQWFKDGVALEGATEAVLTVTAAALDDQGLYHVTVTDGLDTLTSRSARLSLLIAPTFVLQPQSQTVTVGDNVTFTVAVAGNPPPFGFRWRKLPSVTVFHQLVSTTNASFTITNVQLSHTGSYNVVVTNAASVFPGVLSATATLTVTEP